MYLQLAQTETGNFVLSPFSLETALAMLVSGSTENSKTRSEILNVLNVKEDFEDFQRQFAELLLEYKVNYFPVFCAKGHRAKV